MQADMKFMRVSPLAVLRVSALLAVVLFVLMFGVFAGLYTLIDSFGVIKRVQDLFNSIAATPGQNPLSFLNPDFVLPRAAVVLGGLSLATVPLNVLLSFLLNLVLRVTNGLDVTLKKREPKKRRNRHGEGSPPVAAVRSVEETAANSHP